MAMISTLTRSGQVSIPEEILRRLDLAEGTLLRCEVAEGGIFLRPARETAPGAPVGERRKISGLLRHLASAKPVTVAEMNRAVEAAAAER
jgi:AbrB family looped-hinge helix DNA binding protein